MIFKNLILFLAISIFSANSFANKGHNNDQFNVTIDAPSCINQDFLTNKILFINKPILNWVSIAGTVGVDGASAVIDSVATLIGVTALGGVAGGLIGVFATEGAAVAVGADPNSDYVNAIEVATGTVGAVSGAVTVYKFIKYLKTPIIYLTIFYVGGTVLISTAVNTYDGVSNYNKQKKNYEEQKNLFSTIATNCQHDAENGDVKAQTLLGYLYLRGVGTDRDLELGLNYLRQAAKQDHQDAIDILEIYWI